MGLKSDLIKVGSSNVIVLISSLINGLILPAVLSIQDFANLKTFTLYASFIGFMHLGFVDGINVKYGGHTKDSNSLKGFGRHRVFFYLFQAVITIIFVCIGLLLDNDIILFVGIAIIPLNIQSFFLSFYQAIGEFKLYSKSLIIVPIFNTTLTLTFLVFNIIDYKAFIVIYILSYFLSILFLEFNYKIENKYEFRQSLIKINYNWFITELRFHRKIFNSGIYIMLGSVLFTMFFDIGRWMSKIFTNHESFATYSLSVSLIGLIVVFVAAMNKTFYPHLHRNRSNKVIDDIKNNLYVFGSVSISAFFIIKEIVIYYIPKYNEAIPTTAILITAIPGIFIIKTIYVNLYKVHKKEWYFMRDTIIFLIISMLITLINYYFFKSLNSIAVSSVISVYLWALYPLTFNSFNIRGKLKELFFVLFMILAFYITYILNLNLIYSMLLYISALIVLNMLFFNKISISIASKIIEKIISI